MSTYVRENQDEKMVQTALRLPAWLRDDLKGRAKEEGQSLNTFIVRSLKKVGADAQA
jgi:predicted HicB family RNase H-like nuclease